LFPVDKKKLAILGGVGLAALLLLVSRRGSAGPSVPKGAKILLFGDSLALGLSAPMKKIAEGSGYDFASSGVVGSRTDQWEGKLTSLLATEQPSLVLVSLGTNDGAMNDPASQEVHFKNLADLLTAYGSDFVWIAPPSMPAHLKMGPVRSLIWRYSPKVIDSAQMNFDRAPDGIHSSPAGYADWALQAWQKLVEMGEVA
jgi:lysophospholipase L1-like esterase